MVSGVAKRRSKLELYLEVLRAINKGVNKPTNIMYKCNLSWMNLKEILNSLLKQNLISVIEENGRRVYGLTDRGRDFLEYLSRAQMLLVSGGEKRRKLM